MQLIFGAILASIFWGLALYGVAGSIKDLEAENKRLRDEHKRLINDEQKLLDLYMQCSRAEIDRELGK